MTTTKEDFIKLLAKLITEELQKRNVLVETPNSKKQESLLIERIIKLQTKE